MHNDQVNSRSNIVLGDANHSKVWLIMKFLLFFIAVKLTKQIMHQTVTKSFLGQSFLSTTLLYAGLYMLVYKIDVSNVF